MSDPDEELEESLAAVAEAKENLTEDEQNTVDIWIAKLSEPKDTDEEKKIRNEYARILARLTKEGQLVPPFTEPPPDGDLKPLLSGDKQKKVAYPGPRLPCSRTKGPPVNKGAIPKVRKVDKKPVDRDEFMNKNEFEDYEEMAKVIARSKGQSFAEFIVAISRHTSDYGQQLRAAMKTETTNFREYVDHVLSQRIKDLTEVLDEEQNAELQRIKKDIDKWQVELSHCKKRIREMIPDFDLEAYKKDKYYLKKIFAIGDNIGGFSEDDSFRKWREESCHRLKWYSDMINKTARCNEGLAQEITDIKSQTLDLEAQEARKQQNHIQLVSCEYSEYQKLKSERDRLSKENNQLTLQLEEGM